LRRHADSRIFTPPSQEPASHLNAKPQCPKDAKTITIDKFNSQWILPRTDAEFAEKKGKMIAFSAPSTALREMRAWGLWFRLTNITAYVPRNGDTILLWNVTN
jgi:hypothetical protein